MSLYLAVKIFIQNKTRKRIFMQEDKDPDNKEVKMLEQIFTRRQTALSMLKDLA